MKGLSVTGHRATLRRWCLAGLAAFALIACSGDTDDGGGLGVPGTQSARGGQDVERPDIFSVTDRGLWDGRPSLGGVWVAHPDVSAPERVVIRNTQTGQFVTGALFRRERDNPGPVLQVSSDAAEALAMLAGAPTELSVIALRRQETAPAPEEPVLASPDDIAATPLPPAADTVVVELPPAPAPAAAPAAAPEPAPVAAPAAATGLPPAPLAQIGVFGVRANADTAVARLGQAGLTAAVLPLGNAWRVVAGPVPDAATLTRIKGLGFADAYVIRD
jgi:rare lipoprotein A